MKRELFNRDKELNELIKQYPEDFIVKFKELMNNYEKNVAVSIKNNIEKTEEGSCGK